jgi:diguanylate cyclase (GGDEF)-like protein/PAS domain S-box-containing protein
MPKSVRNRATELGFEDIDQKILHFSCHIREMPVAMFFCEPDGNCFWVNEAYLQLLGCTPDQALGLNWLNFFPEDERAKAREGLIELAKRPEAFEARHRLNLPSGESLFVRSVSKAVIGPKGNIGFFGCIKNETSLVEIINNLQERENLLTTMTNAMSEGIVVQDKARKIIVSNPAAERILKLSASLINGELSMDPDWKAIRGDGSPFPGHEHPPLIALKEGITVQDVIMGINIPGHSTCWISINSAPLFDPETGEVYATVSTFTDITERQTLNSQIDEQVQRLNESHIELEIKQAQLEMLNSKLKFQAETDSLTLLFNRGAILDRLNRIYEHRIERDFGVILLDIDHFKQINDEFGHEAGDTVLKLAASTLSEYMPNGGAVGRYGGEEFLVVLTECTFEDLSTLAEILRLGVEKMTDSPRTVTISLGYAHANLADTPDHIVRLADNALYTSKRNGRNQATGAAPKAA